MTTLVVNGCCCAGVTSVSPNAGCISGGNWVTITGFGFTSSITSIVFGTLASPSFVLVNNTTINAIVPPSPIAEVVTVLAVIGSHALPSTATYTYYVNNASGSYCVRNTTPWTAKAPPDLALDLSGNVWAYGNNPIRLPPFFPTSGFTAFGQPSGVRPDLVTVFTQYGGLCLGPDGKMWFSFTYSNPSNPVIPFTSGAYGGVFAIDQNGTVTGPFRMSGFLAIKNKGLCAGPDGNLWVADGTGKVWKVTTGGTVTPYALGGAMNGICAGPDGNLWASDSSGRGVWKVTTDGAATKYPLTSSLPGGLCTGPDGNLWIADYAGAVWKVTTDGTATRYTISGDSRNPQFANITYFPNGIFWATANQGPGGNQTNTLLYSVRVDGTIAHCSGGNSCCAEDNNTTSFSYPGGIIPAYNSGTIISGCSVQTYVASRTLDVLFGNTVALYRYAN